MKRRTAEPQTQAAAAPPAPVVPTSPFSPTQSAPAQRPVGPHSYEEAREEAEERYIAARDLWVTAMHAANSGRPVDLASLALTQETYEAAAAERERWIAGARVAIPIGRDAPRRNLEAAVGQEMAWRKVRHHEKREGFLRRLKRRITG